MPEIPYYVIESKINKLLLYSQIKLKDLNLIKLEKIILKK